ncbi:CHAP domain-containing protein [Streptococcus cuniculipharyngis]|uniref:N-acetylmuramoyl-L-alanine amidase n=1 Tax=Streptococcus cuniculipharyngis TaxID=1562651 RepID=A0A5C5S814_9STRE|nr:CHAP domain-containing protein [Streptococcus cuniculipharyngis]TWS96256.1 CHAP domain-containing protein [Streptococcus cuniculipharyngis]
MQERLYKLIVSVVVLLALVSGTKVSASSRTSIVTWAERLASQGQGVDYDGVYGMQCVDLVNWILGKHFGKPIWGNAINLLDSAQQAGYQVIRNNGINKPEVGDIFIMRTYAHIYGHAGLIISDEGGSYGTIEQNVDGGTQSLTLGGPARRLRRTLNNPSGVIIGWIRPPYQREVSPQWQAPAPVVIEQGNPVFSSPSNNGYQKVKDSSGRFVVTVNQLNVRNSPSLAGSPVASYSYGQSFYFDSVYQGDGYLWLSYVSSSGVRRYVAQGPATNGVLSGSYGRIE